MKMNGDLKHPSNMFLTRNMFTAMSYRINFLKLSIQRNTFSYVIGCDETMILVILHLKYNTTDTKTGICRVHIKMGYHILMLR